MLTSNGAWLDLHGTWKPPAPLDVGMWTHQATHGRDHHVVLTYLGYLLPFGHPAVLVKETQRRFEAAANGLPVANLRTRTYVKIRKHDKTYGDGSDTVYQAYEGRN